MTTEHVSPYQILPAPGYTPTIGYQLVTFEERQPTAAENDAWSAALKLGDKGRHDIRGHELQFYLDELRRTRAVTLAALSARDDAWLEAPLRIAPGLNAHWAWFHVAEDEINHRGQMRWLRARLPQPRRVFLLPPSSFLLPPSRNVMGMKKTLHIDERLLREARSAAGARTDTDTVRLGLEALIRRAAYERLRALRGSEPRARDTPRRRERPSAARHSAA